MGALASGAIAMVSTAARRIGGPTLLGVPVSAAILTRVAAVRPEQPLDEVAQLFVAGRHEVMPVIDHGRAVSVITRGDVATGLLRVGPHAPVAAAPSHHVVAVTLTDSLAHVIERLQAMPGAVAVVLDHGGAVGVLTAESVAAYLDDVTRGAA